MTEEQINSITLESDFIAIVDRLMLTDRQKRILVLRYCKGMMMVDIAEEVGVNRNKVSAELEIAKRKLMDFKIE